MASKSAFRSFSSSRTRSSAFLNAASARVRSPRAFLRAAHSAAPPAGFCAGAAAEETLVCGAFYSRSWRILRSRSST
jgi:hypothetical protein